MLVGHAVVMCMPRRYMYIIQENLKLNDNTIFGGGEGGIPRAPHLSACRKSCEIANN